MVLSELDLLGDVRVELVDLYSLLLHRISVADGNAAVLYAVEVVGDAERCADLVLTAVTLADGARVVKVDHEVLGELLSDRVSLVAELL